jgi:nucleoside transporter
MLIPSAENESRAVTVDPLLSYYSRSERRPQPFPARITGGIPLRRPSSAHTFLKSRARLSGSFDMSTATVSAVPRLDPGLRINLSIMMFLQFAIWGAWATVIGNYLKHLKFDETVVGWVGALMPLGAIIAPMIVGQLADRYVASEKLMAVLHLGGAALMYWVAQIQGEEQLTVLLVALTGYALLYNPTLALSNSIVFAHVPDGQRDFPGIRVLGTIGWIAAGFALDYVLAADGTPVDETNRFLLLTAGLSAVLGVYSFFLPHTPPSGKSGDPLPFVKALGLFRNSSFAVFFGVSFVITIVLAFYYSFTPLYLKQVHKVPVASTMIWGQVAETVLLPLLPLFLWFMGMKWVLALGMFCWGLRYAFFAMSAGGQPYALAFLGILLHGACFDFFFAAGFIHVDNEAPKDIRASGQALFGFLTYGLGMFIGSIVGGYLAKALTTGEPPNDVTDWATFWWIPSVGVLVSLLIFVVFFRMNPKKAEPA